MGKKKISDSPGPFDDITGSYDRLTETELANLGIVMGAVRMFRGNRRGHLAYVSMPITSGKRYFDVLTEHGVRSQEGLAKKVGKDALYELVIKPNVEEGVAYADQLGMKQHDLLFIAPSVFEAKKWRWSQDAYMSMWYRVLGEMIGNHFLMNGWEYSTGGVKEVLFSLFMQWDVFGREARRIHDDDFLTLFNAVGIKDFLTDLPAGRSGLEEVEEMRKIRIHSPSGIDVTNYALIWAIEKVTAAILDLRERDLPYEELLDLCWKMSLNWHRGRVPEWYTNTSPRHSALVRLCFGKMRQIMHEQGIRPTVRGAE